MDDAGAGRGRILTVCTANICRSPLAELHLLEALADGPFRAAEIASAGVRGLEGAAMCAVARECLDAPSHGDAHRGRELTSDLVVGADLVLTMESEQRGAVARLAPGHQGKVFTLREAAAMIDAVAAQEAPMPTSVPELVERMRALRGLVRPPLPAIPEPRGLLRMRGRTKAVPADDGLSVADGHNFGSAAHADTVSEVQRLTGMIGEALSRRSQEP